MGIDISNEELVVRILLSVSKDGVILPNSFKLREWPEPKGPERYISVNRYESPALVSDLLNEIEEGKEKEANLMAIRRKLVDIASKSKTSVDTLCSQK